MPLGPYSSPGEHLIDQWPQNSEVARNVRRGDARLRLQELATAEISLAEADREIAKISDPLERQQAEHQLNMDCLVRFGCRADERATFRDVLLGVAEHGGSTLFEAATLTSMICRQRTSAAQLLAQRSGQSVKSGGVTELLDVGTGIV